MNIESCWFYAGYMDVKNFEPDSVTSLVYPAGGLLGLVCFVVVFGVHYCL